MCRLCAAVVGAGLFENFGQAKILWRPEEKRTKPVAHVLREDFFNWVTGPYEWRDDLERVQLFAFLLIEVHRFVLLHEAAHVLHEHGARDGDRMLGTVVDGGASFASDEAAAANSMARELVADAEAFHLHFRLLEHRFAQPADEMALLLHEKLVGTPRARLRLTLLAAYMVFQILDHRDWSIKTARLRSHPPAPFRMKAIYATAVDLKHPELPLEVLTEEIVTAGMLGSFVVDVALDRFPQLGWMRQVDGPDFDLMFLRIYENMEKWADPSRLRSAKRRVPVSRQTHEPTKNAGHIVDELRRLMRRSFVGNAILHPGSGRQTGSAFTDRQ